MITTDSPILRTSVKVMSPLALVVATYLFFAGHNKPGGGFAAGLVIGAVVILRIITGLQRDIEVSRILAIGSVVTVGVAVAPIFWGEPILDQVLWQSTVPVVGKIKFGSALFFDLGVTLIVVGMVIAAIEGLGGMQHPVEEEF